jgi:hypothetical protein
MIKNVKARKLTDKQEKVIILLLKKKPIDEIANILEVPEETICKWLDSDHVFQRA